MYIPYYSLLLFCDICFIISLKQGKRKHFQRKNFISLITMKILKNISLIFSEEIIKIYAK
ncbi:hypothetical protein HMPREF1871_00455 [Gemelliphila asaccharolytica]|uniref:Uncharacterized protein n=1 Tax=Gemelliphila asaccharolytica TaxID=502393 RepID=A0ABR5TMH2_9BACL|nr:hypothetical protein HMPREF1871_00455 [Gemella asaccharolytica]